MRKSLLTEFLGLFFLLLFSLAVAIIYWNILESKKIVRLNQLNQQSITNNLNQILNLQGQTIQKYIEDYSHWTDMYRFTINKNPSWAKINIDVSLNTFKVNYTWVFDKKGKMVYQVNSEKTPLLEFPADKNVSNIGNLFENNWLTHYFILLASGEIAEVFGSWIHLEDDIKREAKNPLGYFFSAKIWDQKYIDNLGNLMGGKSFITTDSNQCPLSKNQNIIQISKNLYNHNHKSIAILCTLIENQLNKTATSYARYSLIFFTTFSICLVTVLLFFLYHRVIKPIKALAQAVASENLSILNPYISSVNEFGSLSRLVGNYQQTKIQKEKLQGQLFHAGKMASLGILGAGVAHEFNNPLTVVLANAQILTTFSEQNKLSPELLKKQLTAISHQAERMRILVDRMREFSRAESNSLQEIKSDLALIIDKSLILLKMQMDKLSIQTDFNIAKDLPAFLCDPIRIETLIQNLVSNACDALGENPNIKDKKISIQATYDKEINSIIIKITDNAQGIPESIQEHIFDPFFTTKPVGKGTGLGLSLAYGVVKDHGGEITFKTTSGKGTTFQVILPHKT